MAKRPKDVGLALDELLDKLIRPIEDIYAKVEIDLLKDIALRLSTYDEVGGVLEWRIQKLNELGAVNKQTLEILSRLSGRSLQEIRSAIEQVVGTTIDYGMYQEAYEAGHIIVNPANVALTRALQSRYDKAKDMVKLIESNMLDSHRKEYLHLVDKVYLETTTGIKSYSESINDGIKDLAEKGISGATYKRKSGATYEMAIEPVVRRDILTTLIQSAGTVQEEMIRELGVQHIYVSQHLGARTGHRKDLWENHEQWQGKIYTIDEFEEKTGYGEMLGLCGINCRHLFYPHFEGVSVAPPPKINTKENNRIYNLTQRQRAKERAIRKTRKSLEVAKVLEDDTLEKHIRKRLKSQTTDIQNFIKNNPELTRDYTRERIQ